MGARKLKKSNSDTAVSERRTEILDIYSVDMNKFSVPTREEEAELFNNIVKSGNEFIKSIVPYISEEKWKELDILLNNKDIILKIEANEFEEFKDSKGKLSFINIMKIIRMTEAGKLWQESCLEEIIDTSSLLLKEKERIISTYRKTQKLKANFVHRNLRLVLSITKKYVRSSVWHTHADLVQEGNIGLMKAVERFDPDKGFKFSTYAVWWIRQNMTRSLDDSEKSIRTPINQLETQRKMRAMDIKFYALHGRSPSVEEYSEAINDGKERIERTLERRIHSIFRIDLPTSEGTSFHDIIRDEDSVPSDETVLQNELFVKVNKLLTRLTPQESSILRWRFGLNGKDPMTLAEVGDIVGVTRERIRQIEAAAIRKLRTTAKDLQTDF